MAFLELLLFVPLLFDLPAESPDWVDDGLSEDEDESEGFDDLADVRRRLLVMLAGLVPDEGPVVVEKDELTKLVVWVKCQRRQRKLLDRGDKSTLTDERISRLDAIGFDWNPKGGIHSHHCIY